MQHRGVDVRHVMTILDRVKSKFIGAPMLDPTANTATGQPRTETLRMMIPAGILRTR